MRISSFLTTESGAITVDWVVLTAGVAGVALATAGVLSSGLADANDAVATEMSLTDATSDSWAVMMANYSPFDADLYAQLYNGFATLSNEDLQHMELFVNDILTVLQPEAETAEENGMLNDLTFSIGRVFAERNTLRSGETGANQTEIERILAEMGWDQAMVGGG